MVVVTAVVLLPYGLHTRQRGGIVDVAVPGTPLPPSAATAHAAPAAPTAAVHAALQHDSAWDLWQPFDDGGHVHGSVREALSADDIAARRLAPDIFELLPEDGARFMAGRSPCWKRNDTTPLRCLPAYFLLGVFQCGVRDLHERLAVHPDIAPTANAMPHFWDEQWPFSRYLDVFTPAVERIREAPERYIAGDSSFSTFTYTWTGSARVNVEWDATFKRCRETMCMNNATCIAATCYNYTNTVSPPLHGGGSGLTLPRLLRRVYGAYDVRMVVVLRDPVERLHAAYWNYGHYGNVYGQNETGFSLYAREMVGHITRCLQTHSEAECVTAFEALDPENEAVFYHCDQVLKSLYAPFMAGWLQSFGDSLLVLRLEDWKEESNRDVVRQVLTQTWAHLQLPPPELDAGQWDRALTGTVKRAGDEALRARRGDMEPATRRFLRDFYRPYNRRLADMLDDQRFLWE